MAFRKQGEAPGRPVWVALLVVSACIGFQESRATERVDSWVIQQDSSGDNAQEQQEGSPRNSEPEGWRRFWRGFGRENVNGRAHRSVREAFKQIAGRGVASTVKIYCGRVQVAQGTVVDANGLILTKASELKENPECRFADGRALPAELVTIRDDLDLALLHVNASDLVPISWRVGEPPAAGSWLISVDTSELPLAIGVVSNEPRTVQMPRAILGVMLADSENGARIANVMEGSPAERAGLKPDDVVTELNNQPIANRDALIKAIRAMRPGDEVKLVIVRDGQKQTVTARLVEEDRVGPSRERFQNTLGGPLSQRRWGFSEVVEHDSALRPSDCGGPILDVEGKAVGINIARAGRVVSYALPYRALAPFLEEIRSGKYGPVAEADEKQLAIRLHQLRKTSEDLARRVEELVSKIDAKKQAAAEQDPERAQAEISELERALAEVRSKLQQTLEELRRYEKFDQVSMEKSSGDSPQSNR